MTVRAISGNIALLCNTCELSYLISSEVSGSKYFQKLDLDTTRINSTMSNHTAKHISDYLS